MQWRHHILQEFYGRNQYLSIHDIALHGYDGQTPWLSSVISTNAKGILEREDDADSPDNVTYIS